MRDKNGGKPECRTGGTRGPARETLASESCSQTHSAACGIIYSSVPTYSIDYEAMNTKKKGDSDLARELSWGVGRVGLGRTFQAHLML